MSRKRFFHPLIMWKRNQKKGKILLPGKGGKSCENSDCPSKFLILCLKSIQSALQQDVTFNRKEDEPLLVNEWGVELFIRNWHIGDKWSLFFLGWFLLLLMLLQERRKKVYSSPASLCIHFKWKQRQNDN